MWCAMEALTLETAAAGTLLLGTLVTLMHTHTHHHHHHHHRRRRHRCLALMEMLFVTNDPSLTPSAHAVNAGERILTATEAIGAASPRAGTEIRPALVSALWPVFPVFGVAHSSTASYDSNG